MILPGSMIGMLGGGQLGRMFVAAARTMGYRICVLEPDPQSPAGLIADNHIQAAYDDVTALTEFAEACEVITTEFENVPAHVLKSLARRTLVRPNAAAVMKSQDRIDEKAFTRECGLLTAEYGVIATSSDIANATKGLSFPCLLKTARLGYDGKGQALVNSVEDVKAAFEQFKSVPCVLEQRVNLKTEISVILARSPTGEVQCFPVAENIHRQGILHKTVVPARVSAEIAEAAQVAASRIAQKLDYIGVMAVEFFVTRDDELLVNEMAPRTHNSGHYTLDACVTSQFEQQVRMICGLPFGSARLLSPVVMVNILGDLWSENEAPNWHALLADPNAKLHLYGKAEARTVRKMGHFCVLADDINLAESKADSIFARLDANANL